MCAKLNIFCYRIEVPPVLDAGPTEEPLWSLKMRLRNVVSQINEEGRFVTTFVSLVSIYSNYLLIN